MLVLKSWNGFPRDTVKFPSIPRGRISSCQAWYRVERNPVFEVGGGIQGQHPASLPALGLRHSTPKQGNLEQTQPALSKTLLFLHLHLQGKESKAICFFEKNPRMLDMCWEPQSGLSPGFTFLDHSGAALLKRITSSLH